MHALVYGLSLAGRAEQVEEAQAVLHKHLGGLLLRLRERLACQALGQSLGIRVSAPRVDVNLRDQRATPQKSSAQAYLRDALLDHLAEHLVGKLVRAVLRCQRLLTVRPKTWAYSTSGHAALELVRQSLEPVMSAPLSSSP